MDIGPISSYASIASEQYTTPPPANHQPPGKFVGEELMRNFRAMNRQTEAVIQKNREISMHAASMAPTLGQRVDEYA